MAEKKLFVGLLILFVLSLCDIRSAIAAFDAGRTILAGGRVEANAYTGATVFGPTLFPKASSTPTRTPSSAPPATARPTQAATSVPATPHPAVPGPTHTPVPDSSRAISLTTMLPLILRLEYKALPVPPPLPDSTTEYFACSAESRSIPDNDAPGISDSIHVDDPRFLLDLNVGLTIDHTFISDLSIQLRHEDTGTQIRLVQAARPGCSYDNLRTILDDDMPLAAKDQCAASPAALSGMYSPLEPLSAFEGEQLTGDWTLEVADLNSSDSGFLRSWCLAARVAEALPEFAPTRQPPNLPGQARIYNISGKHQSMPLDCESRTAVDYANYFGVSINEYEFFNNLPKTENPDTGFVGDVYGSWGNIPPNAYGVHAEPVAALLRSYGVDAYAHRPLSWDNLRAELAASRPVYVFIVGSSPVYNGIPVIYTPTGTRATGARTTITARYEHTVMVIGYTDSTVTILDGGSIYSQSKNSFLASWSALGNMAITTQP